MPRPAKAGAADEARTTSGRCREAVRSRHGDSSPPPRTLDLPLARVHRASRPGSLLDGDRPATSASAPKGGAMRIEGRMALVTGATGGIGHAIARALAGRGAKLVLTGRQTEVLGRLARELDAQVFAVDLADRRALQHLIERTEDVDILVANAALPASGRIAALTDDEIDAALDVNLRAPILLARSLAMRMVARGSGHLRSEEHTSELQSLRHL